MPRLWSDRLETHRQAVTETILDTTIELVRRERFAGVSMKRIAAEAGIGGATLYKYFHDVDGVLKGKVRSTEATANCRR